MRPSPGRVHLLPTAVGGGTPDRGSMRQQQQQSSVTPRCTRPCSRGASKQPTSTLLGLLVLVLLYGVARANLLTPISMGIDLGNHKRCVYWSQRLGSDAHPACHWWWLPLPPRTTDRLTSSIPSNQTRSVVALAQGNGVEVWVNDMGRRETPTAILFRGRRCVSGHTWME